MAARRATRWVFAKGSTREDARFHFLGRDMCEACVTKATAPGHQKSPRSRYTSTHPSDFLRHEPTEEPNQLRLAGEDAISRDDSLVRKHVILATPRTRQFLLEQRPFVTLAIL